MAQTEEIRVPDIGDFDEVDVIEVLVAPGDRVEEEDGLITLESEKASMDVPSPRAGTVKAVKVEAGGKVKQGDLILVLEVGEEAEAEAETEEEEPEEPEAAEEEPEQEEEKPEPEAGEEEAEAEKKAKPKKPAKEEKGPEERRKRPSAPKQGERPKSVVGKVAAAPGTGEEEEEGESKLEPEKDEDEETGPLDEPVDEEGFDKAYASPAIRHFARELGVDLAAVEGSGRNGRILREDVQAHVKSRLAAGREGRAGAGPGLPELPEIDFTKWGEVETEPLSKIQRLTARNVHRAWLTIPHVTQHDAADVTELEAFRKSLAKEAEARGVKLTPIPFLIRAVVAALRELPRFNGSLAADGETVIVKRYFHIGIAVDTEGGLVVPVIRDADTKGLWALAEEVADLAARARERKLKADELEGGSFTISSLGGIGGTAFSPIVNWPEVAILGVSRAEWRPVWADGELVPRQILPLSLSYDHRVIDGARAVRFTQFLAGVLGDVRRLLL
ncbi:MAG TPA: 2-oxo acid dehydrogenase subunit E2 [Thermoanaerobaculia bacterium]|nr:2-oxo acid dehydrogenase subunit E2 [Thermoanaerobaculia bacterium]